MTRATVVFIEHKKIANGDTVTELYLNAYLTLVDRPTLGSRLFLLVTTAGEIYSETKQDEAGDRLHASFEDTELVEARTEMAVPRMCVHAADRWFAEGPERMRILLHEAQAAAEAEAAKVKP